MNSSNSKRSVNSDEQVDNELDQIPKDALQTFGSPP